MEKWTFSVNIDCFYLSTPFILSLTFKFTAFSGFFVQSERWSKGGCQHIRSRLGFSILPKDTSSCRPGESNHRPSDNQMLALPLTKQLSFSSICLCLWVCLLSVLITSCYLLSKLKNLPALCPSLTHVCSVCVCVCVCVCVGHSVLPLSCNKGQSQTVSTDFIITKKNNERRQHFTNMSNFTITVNMVWTWVYGSKLLWHPCRKHRKGTTSYGDLRRLSSRAKQIAMDQTVKLQVISDMIEFCSRRFFVCSANFHQA